MNEMFHMLNFKRSFLLWIVVAFGLFIGAVLLLRFMLYPSSCGYLPLGHDYLCFANTIDSIYTSQGVKAAFVYFNDLSDDLNYGAAHLIAHQLGHSLWEDTNDVHQALALIPYVEYSPTEIFRHSGVVHGIFHSYFLYGSETQDVHALIKEACSALGGAQQQRLLHDCSHGVGHGLMAYTNNDILQTLYLCKESLHPDKCADGAFMERGLLYIPGYGSQKILERDDNECASFAPEEGKFCARYAGWTAVLKDLVEKQTSDTTEALKVCEVYTGTLQQECYFLAARDLFTIVYDNDKKAMEAACEKLPIPSSCLQGLVEWEQWDKAYRNLSTGS